MTYISRYPTYTPNNVLILKMFLNNIFDLNYTFYHKILSGLKIIKAF